MTYRRPAACLLGLVLFGSGLTFLRAQSPAPHGRAKLRAEVVRLRTEVRMLRLDYELAHDGLLDDLKMYKGLNMIGPMMQLGMSLQSAANGQEPPKPSDEERKKAAEERKKAEQQDREQKAELAAFIAERKAELSRLSTALEEKKLDLDDAERAYREGSR